MSSGAPGPGPAFDEHNRPQADLLDQCVHCGFCLEACPTYDLWRVEPDSPRGRLVLMSEGLREGSEITPGMVEHFDNCLGCMACVTACPSGVRYDLLIEDTRAQVERNHRRPAGQALTRWTSLGALTRPAVLRLSVPLARIARALRLDRLARLLPGRSRLRSALELAPSAPLSSSFSRFPGAWPAQGERRGRVGMLQGCVQRVFFEGVNVATAELLAAEGYEVASPPSPRCCGALQLHVGSERGAVSLAKQTILAFEDCDHVIANAAGCGSAMKSYGHLLREDPEWAGRAERFSARVRDVTELLAEHPTRAPRNPLPLDVVYHDACHLAHAQGVREAPRKLLREIPGLRLAEPEDQSTCCGSAGIYNLLNPETARRLGERKLANLSATGAEVIAAGNPGCALQIEATARREGSSPRVVHPVELLHASMTGRPEALR